MSNNITKIGISGGTFDPIHFGHLIVAEDIRLKFELDKIVFIPSGMPPHKKIQQVTSAEHRFNMVSKAISSNQFFEIDDLEIGRDGYTYTVDTLHSLKEKYTSNVELYYIIGADTVHDINTWKNYQDVFGLCKFVAALRPGYPKQEFQLAVDNLRQKYNAKISTAYAPQIGISSTFVRQRIKDKMTIKYLVPESVEKYINNNKLYHV